MSTKPAAKTQPFDPASQEAIAYQAAALVATREPNDQARLGYCVWAWMTERKGTLAEAVRAAGIRTDLREPEIVALITGHLTSKGVPVA